MSLTRKQLSDWGITGEVADQIIAAHVSTVDAIKGERDKYASKSVELADALAELEEAKTYKGDMERYKLEAETAIAAKAALEKQIQDNESEAKRTAAITKLLTAEHFHPKGIEKIIRFSGIAQKVKLNEQGEITNADEITALAVGSWGEYQGKVEKFEHVPNNPPNNAGSLRTPGRAVQIAQRVHENLYGKSE